MTRLRLTIAAFLLLLGAAALPVAAQYPFTTPNVVAASSSTTTDLDAYFICVYTGASGNGFATVSAAGTILFESPTSAVANTHIECDASIAADGARNGIIDPAVAACNTSTEVLNTVNKPESDFRCILHAGLGTDDISISGTGWLKAVTDLSCAPPNGCKLVAESAVALSLSAAVAPSPYLLASKYQSSKGGVGRTMQSNAYNATTAYLAGVSTQSAFATTSVFNVYSIKGEYTPIYGANTGTGATVGFTYNEVITTLWGPVTNGATGVVKIFGTCDTPATACSPEWGALGLLGRRDEKMLVRMTNTGASSAFTLQLNGVQFTNK